MHLQLNAVQLLLLATGRRLHLRSDLLGLLTLAQLTPQTLTTEQHVRASDWAGLDVLRAATGSTSTTGLAGFAFTATNLPNIPLADTTASATALSLTAMPLPFIGFFARRLARRGCLPRLCRGGDLVESRLTFLLPSLPTLHTSFLILGQDVSCVLYQLAWPLCGPPCCRPGLGSFVALPWAIPSCENAGKGDAVR